MTSNGFVLQYAIRMPNGGLYQRRRVVQAVTDYSIPAPMRDIMGFLGLNSDDTAAVEQPSGPEIFTTRKAADEALDALRTQAVEVGVSNWGGAVVVRLCTPFSTNDGLSAFSDAVVDWLKANGVQE